jgi:hypothetical protein
MPVVLRSDRLEKTEGRADGAYVIPAHEARQAAATEKAHGLVGSILAVVCVIAGIFALFGGITADSGEVEIPLPGASSIKFDGTPVGLVLVGIGLAFFWLSRPQIKEE